MKAETMMKRMLAATLALVSAIAANAAEVRSVPVPVSVSRVNWRGNVSPVALSFRARKIAATNAVPVVWGDADPRGRSLFSAVTQSWTVNTVRGLPYSGELAPSTMPMPVGDYVIECWMDENGDGKFNPGEVYGCARYTLPATGDVSRVEMEIAEVSPNFMRVDLAKVLDVQQRYAGDLEAGRNEALRAVDRGKWWVPWAQVDVISSPNATNLAFGVSGTVPAWLVCRRIGAAAYYKVLASLGSYRLADSPIITEADLLAAGIVEPCAVSGGGSSTAAIVVFAIVVGSPPAENSENGNSYLMLECLNGLGKGLPIVSPQCARAVETYSGRVVFSWNDLMMNKLNGTLDQPNFLRPEPAYAVKVWDTSPATNLVYSSGVISPPRDADGLYHWVAPASLQLNANSNYVWQVFEADSSNEWASFAPRRDIWQESFKLADAPEFVPPMPLVAPLTVPVAVSHVEWRETWAPKLMFGASAVSSYGGRLVTCDPAYWEPSGLSSPLVSWALQPICGLPYAGVLSAPESPMPIGDYMLECYNDENGDGKFNPGEAYGCAKFALTPSGVVERVEIELTEISPVFPRFDWQDMFAIQSGWAASTNAAYAAAFAATDRGAWEMPWADVERPEFYISTNDCWLAAHPATNLDFVASGNVGAWVVLRDINGAAIYSLLRPYMETRSGFKVYPARRFGSMDIAGRRILTEADFVAAGDLDVGWGLLGGRWQAVGGSRDAITNATFVVLLGDRALEDDWPVHVAYDNGMRDRYGKNEAKADQLIVAVRNKYEYGSAPTAVSDLAVTNGVASWSHANTIAKAYPAAQVRIWSDSAKTSLVWDSGPIKAPARDSGGVYHYRLPGSALPPSGSTWYIGVSMLDAKFTEPAANETVAAFTR